MIGKSRPVRAAALRLSSANRCSSPDTSPAWTECFDIFSPAPGDSDVISQVLRDSSNETKIAPRSVRIAAGAGQGASSIVASKVVGLATSLCRRAPVAIQAPMGSFGHVAKGKFRPKAVTKSVWSWATNSQTFRSAASRQADSAFLCVALPYVHIACPRGMKCTDQPE